MSWPIHPLAALCEIQIGKTPSRSNPAFWEGSHPWATISDFQQGKHIRTTKESITDAAVSKCGCKVVSKGTLLLSFKLSVGKRAFAATDLFTNEAIASLTAQRSEVITPDYLYWVLGSVDYDALTDRAAKGKTLNKAKLSALPIPLPPLPEQKRIAAILDAADALRAKRRESIEQLDSLVQATFLEMFGDPVTNPKGWNAVAIAAAPLHIGDGNYSSKYPKARDFVSAGVPFIRANNLDDRTICDEDMKFISCEQHSDLTKGHLEANDILITTRGDIGKVARVPERHAGSNINAQLVLLRCLDNTLNAHFLGYQLGLPGMLAYIKTHQTGVALKQLPIRSLRIIRIISPPPLLQTRFASIVESIEQQKARQKAHLAELDTLFASLQSRAFKGELVA